MDSDSLSKFQIEEIATQVKCDIVTMAHRARTPHVGSSLSVSDILVALYFDAMHIESSNIFNLAQDACILSKGHGAMALYAVLAAKGLIGEELLTTYAQNGSILPEHPITLLAGVQWSTGSLGHGLSVAAGMAYWAQCKQQKRKCYAVLSDGECQEGATWEAAILASKLKLSNLTVIVDYNRQQAMGATDDISQLEPLADKWQSFGFSTQEVDGHNLTELCDALEQNNSSASSTSKPHAIIAHTVKGKGVSFMEHQTEWHYRSPDAAEYKQAIEELKQASEKHAGLSI